FMRDIFTAVPRVLRAICARDHCKGITTDPVADVATLVARMRASPIRGHVVGSDGRRHPGEVGKLSLLNILVDGDLDPTLQAEFPTAVRAAVQGDTAPLLRLAHRHNQSQTLPESPYLFSRALNWTTVCEELSFPWDQAASLPDRWGMATAEASSIPDASFFPFDRATALTADENRTCVRWPESGSKQLATGPLRRFLKGLPVAPACPHFEDLPLRDLLQAVRGVLVQELFAPPPVPPTSTRQVAPVAGVPRRAARTLGAVELTISDVLRQAFYASLSSSKPVFGGLRGGRMRANGTLDGYSYIPGVAI